MADLNGNMAALVLEEGDGLQELHDWLFGRVADDNDVVVDKVSISPTFYEQLFRTKALFAVFL